MYVASELRIRETRDVSRFMSHEDRVSMVPSPKTKTETETRGFQDQDQDSEVPRPRPRPIKTLMSKTKTETQDLEDQYWRSITGMDCDKQKN